MSVTGTRSGIHVVAGILCRDNGKVLIADRSRSGTMRDYWEFPGGKVMRNESAQAALQRELAEELGVEIAAATFLQTIEHDYPEYRVTVDFFLVGDWRGTPTGVEGQSLRWVWRRDLGRCNLLPADTPLIETLQGM